MQAANAINYKTFNISSSGGTNNVLAFDFFILTVSASIYDFYDAWNSTDGSQSSVFSATNYTKQ